MIDLFALKERFGRRLDEPAKVDNVLRILGLDPDDMRESQAPVEDHLQQIARTLTGRADRSLLSRQLFGDEVKHHDLDELLTVMSGRRR